MTVIDFHSHILPGIDDGSRDLSTTAEMCRESLAQGVDLMVATPHFYAMQDRVEDFLERREAAWQKTMSLPEDERPKLLKGAEVAFFEGISRATRIGQLTVEGTNLLLLEMPFRKWKHSDLQELETMSRDFRILLAHVERYTKIPGNGKLIEEALSLPVHVQINAGPLKDWRQRGSLIKMFRKGQAHVLGSDCHGIHHRVPDIGAGRQILEKKLGREFLEEMDRRGTELLFGENVIVQK